MPKKIELFAQSDMPDNDLEALKKAVNDWLDAHLEADNVEVEIAGYDGKTTIMIYYKTVT